MIYSEEGTTQKAMNQIASAFCSTVEDAGYQSMVYANYSFLTTLLDAEALDDDTAIWLANYNTSTDYEYDYSFWQCSASWSVPGIAGDVDKDFWYLNVDGVNETKLQDEDSDRISISKCEVQLEDHDSKYLGFSVEPDITVTRKGEELEEGEDYIVSYAKNTSPGTGYVIVTGIGDFKDTIVESFLIDGIFGSGSDE